MPIYSIDDLRNVAASAGVKGSDEFLISDYAKRIGMDPFAVAEQLGVKTGKNRGAIAAGLSSGVDDIQGLMYSAGGAVADTFGAADARDWFNRRADINQAESQLNGRPDLERIEDVWDSPSKWLPYAGYQVAKQIPNIASTIAASAIIPEAAIPAALSRGLAYAPKVLGGGSLGAAEGYAAKKAALQAGRGLASDIMGGAAMNYAQGVGSLYQEAVDGGDTEAGAKAMLGGIPYGLSETMPEAMLLGRIKRGSGFSGNLGSRMLKAGASQAGTGATSELLQNEMEMGYNGNVSPEEALSRRLNSGVAGGLVEGLMGLGGGIRGGRKPTLDDNTDQGKPTNLLGIGYDGNRGVGTFHVFPDGSVALNAEQELAKRYNINTTDMGTLNGAIGEWGRNRGIASTQVGDSNPGVFTNMVYGQSGLGGNPVDLLGKIAGSRTNQVEDHGLQAFDSMIYGQGGLSDQNDVLGRIAGDNPSLGAPGGRETFANMIYGHGGLATPNDLLGSIAGSNPSLGAPGGPHAFDGMLYGQGGLVDPNTLFDLQTQPAPLQQRIDQNMGIGQPGAPKNYPQQFRAAASEPTNMWAIDPATGHEVRLDAGQASAIHAGDNVQLTPEVIRAQEVGVAAAQEKKAIEGRKGRTAAAGLDPKKVQHVQAWSYIEEALDNGVIDQAEAARLAANVATGVDKVGGIQKYLTGLAATKQALKDGDAKAKQSAIDKVQQKASNGTPTTQAQQAAPQGSQAPAAAAPAAAVSNQAPVVSGEAPVVAPKQPRTLAERAAEAWGSLAKVTPHMPAYESLSDNQRRGIEDLVNRGEFNLAAANTVAGKVASGLDKIAEGDQAADAPVDAPSVAKRLVEIVGLRPSDPNRPTNPEAAAIYDERMGNYTKAIPTRPELKAALLHVLTTTKSPQIRSRLTLATGYDVSEEDGVPHLIQVNNPATLTQVAEHELSGGDEKVELDPQKVGSLKASISKQLGKNTGFYQEVIDRVVANDAPEPVSGAELGLDENGKLDKYQTGDTISEVTGTQLTESVQDHIKKRVKAELKLIAKDGYSDEAIAAAYERLSQIETRESKASSTESEQSDDETAGGRDTLFDNRSEADATEDGESKSQDDGNAAESNSNAYTDALAEALANKVLDTKRKRTRVALGDAKLDEAEKQKRKLAAIRSAVDTLRLFARQPGFTEAASAWNILRSEGVPDFEQLPVVRQAAWVQTYFQQLRNVNDKTVNKDQFRWELENEQRSFEVGADFALESKLERAATGSSNDRAVESNRAGSDGSRTAAAEPQDVGTRAKAKLKKVGYKASKTDLTDEELAWAIKEFERLNNGDALADARKVAESRQAAAPVAETEERPATPFVPRAEATTQEAQAPATVEEAVLPAPKVDLEALARNVGTPSQPTKMAGMAAAPTKGPIGPGFDLGYALSQLPKTEATAEPAPEWATNHVADLGGEVVYFDSDTALVSGYNTFTGRVLYSGVHRATGNRTRVDIRSFTGNLFTPEQKANLAAQADRLDAESKAKQEQNPDGPFTAGDNVAATDSIAPALADYVRGLLKTLNMDGVRVFLLDPSDVRGNREKYKLFGTFGSAGSAGLDANEDGSMRKFGDRQGDFYVSLRPGISTAQSIETLAHEVGHIVQRVAYENADAATKTAIKREYDAWYAANKGKNLKEVIPELRNRETAAAHIKGVSDDLKPSSYWLSFSEWFADNVSRWATTADKPMSLVDKFFKSVAEQIRKLAAAVAGKKYVPNPAVAKFLDEMTSGKFGAEPANVGTPFSKPQFSKSGKATKGSNAKTLAAELRAFMRVGTLGNRVVVVQSIKDIPAGVQRSVGANQNTQGFVFGGKAYLIADQIAAGNGRAVFLHEVGAHLGMEEILGAHYDTLVSKVMEWAKRVDNSQEFKLADKAIQRALDAAGNGELNDTELVAYFIEEAVNAGIEPSALKHGPLRQFLQQVFDLFKKAIARFYGNPDKVTAQDFVDLAYGAARIEMKEPINPGGGDGAPKFSIAKKAEDQARKVAGETGAKIAVDTTNLASKALGALTYLHDIVESAKAKLPSAEKWYKATMDIQAARNRMNQEAERIVKMFTETGIRADKVNKMLFDATFEQKWPYDTQRLDRKTGQMVTIKADPELANRFDNELTAKERAIVKAVFAHGEKTLDHKYAVLKKLGLTGTFKAETGKLQGPYAPLKRFGNYISVLKSADLVAAEDAGDEKLAEKLKADPEHYEVRFHDTKGQASEYARANAKAGGQAYHFEKSERVGGALPMNSRVLSNIRAALKMDDKMPPQARSHFEQMLQELEFQALDEHHARTSGLTRKNRAGAEEDMMRSFLANARAQANFLAQLEYGKEANTQFYAMQREASKDGYAGQDEFNLLAKHYAASFDTRDTPIQNRITAMTTAFQLATSLGYHITNALQGVMVTVPKLAADFNDYTGAMDQLHNGYKTWLAAGGLKGKFDLDSVKDAGLRAALQHAADMGVLDVGMTEDLSQFEAFRTGYKGIDAASGKMSKLMHKLNQVSRYVETANRVSAATAAYKMAMAKHGDQAKAQEYAARILQTTQGDFSATGSPLIFKKLPKFVMQYKKYQFMMASLYANAFNAALRGATPEERAVGRRFLAYKLATTGVAAGFLGLPLMNVAALAFGMTGDDDEPKDLERSLRDWIGDGGLADLILRGPLNAIGLDMSAKLGDDKIFSIAPYTDIDFSSGASAAKTLVGIGGGPAATQIMRMATGVEYLSKGDMQKGFENLVPSGLANASKALRIANEGYTLKNGTVMYSPDEISGLTLMFDAIGLKSSQMKHMEWVRGQQYEIGKFVSDRTKELKADYVQAYRDGNTDELGKLSEHWVKLQDTKRELRPMFNNSVDELKTQPLSDLLRSPANALKRDMKAQKASW